MPSSLNHGSNSCPSLNGHIPEGRFCEREIRTRLRCFGFLQVPLRLTGPYFTPDWSLRRFKAVFAALWKVEQQGSAVIATWVPVPIWVFHRSFALKNVLEHSLCFPGVMGWRPELAVHYFTEPELFPLLQRTSRATLYSGSKSD